LRPFTLKTFKVEVVVFDFEKGKVYQANLAEALLKLFFNKT